MHSVHVVILASALAVALASPGIAAETSSPELVALATPADPGAETVLIGRAVTGDMIIQLELEPAKPMWMAKTASIQMYMNQSKGSWELLATPPMWSEHSLRDGDLYHVEVKPIDPKSNTRIPYAEVRFKAVNRDTGHQEEGVLHPMWGGSGLHYALNSGLSGDGTYDATVTVNTPSVARSLEDKFLWTDPQTAHFHFRLANGKLTHVSEVATD